MSSSKIRIYTDGSCSPNPGPGAWGSVLLFPEMDTPVELTGFEEKSTNNRMELTAALKALETLNEPSDVELFTDSRYLQQGVTSWMRNWQKNNWCTISGEAVKNRDLWESLAQLLDQHRVEWIWVKGHGDNRWNNRADELATVARQQRLKSHRQDYDGICLYPGVTWKNSTGCGTWAVIMHYRHHHKIIGGYVEATTANCLYLITVIEALKMVKKQLPVYLFTKSGYLRDGLETWLAGWQKRDWKTREGNEVSNKELWQEILRLQRNHRLKVVTPSAENPPCFLQEAKEIAREFEEII